jgi:hypothetical protein
MLQQLAIAISVLLALGACASTRASADDDGSQGDDEGGEADARMPVDARPVVDAALIEAIDAARPSADASQPEPDACVPSWHDLLVNPSFEGGGNGWTQAPEDLIRDDIGPGADTPTYAAWLGGVADGDDSLTQDVAIPADATGLRVTGKRFIASVEEPGGSEYDTLDIALLDTAGGQLELLQHLSDNDADESWQPFDIMAASAHAGTTVRLSFHATTDVSLNTNFFLDTLTLQVLRCP